MSRYIVEKAYNIRVQENDACNIQFIAPVEISLTGKKAVLYVKNDCGESQYKLELSPDNGKITTAGQTIVASILPADTLGKKGTTPWLLRVYSNSTDGITIGKGQFQIIGEDDLV